MDHTDKILAALFIVGVAGLILQVWWFGYEYDSKAVLMIGDAEYDCKPITGSEEWFCVKSNIEADNDYIKTLNIDDYNCTKKWWEGLNCN